MVNNMTYREYIQSLPDEEFAKYISKRDYRENGSAFNKPCVCDYKHEYTKRCEDMNYRCDQCMLDFLRSEVVVIVEK